MSLLPGGRGPTCAIQTTHLGFAIQTRCKDLVSNVSRQRGQAGPPMCGIWGTDGAQKVSNPGMTAKLRRAQRQLVVLRQRLPCCRQTGSESSGPRGWFKKSRRRSTPVSSVGRWNVLPPNLRRANCGCAVSGCFLRTSSRLLANAPASRRRARTMRPSAPRSNRVCDGRLEMGMRVRWDSRSRSCHMRAWERGSSGRCLSTNLTKR